MKNPLWPFAGIFAGGIILIFVISLYGLSVDNNEEKASGGEKTTQQESGQSSSGKSEGSGNKSGGEKSGGGKSVSSINAKKVFEGTCASCHGANLQGGVGPALKHVGKRMSQQEIRKQIKTGGGAMPPGLLKGAKAKAVAQWLSKKK